MLTGSKIGQMRFSGSSRRLGLPSERLFTARLVSAIKNHPGMEYVQKRADYAVLPED